MSDLHNGKGYLLKTGAIGLAILLGMGVLPINAEAQNPNEIPVTIQQKETAFLNVAGGAIPGDATVSPFIGDIVVLAASYGIAQTGEWEEGEQTTGRVTRFGDMSITKYLDIASPRLAHASAMKTQFDKIELNLLGKDDLYATVTAEKVIVTSVAVGVEAGVDRPVENVTFSYRKITWRYGSVTTSYDLASATD